MNSHKNYLKFNVNLDVSLELLIWKAWIWSSVTDGEENKVL